MVALLKFMVIRKAGHGPFFMHGDKKGLNRIIFVDEVKKAMRARGLSGEGISGHSFWIGAATAASLNGASDEEAKALGRWKSREYKGCIRTGSSAQAAFSKETVRGGEEGRKCQLREGARSPCCVLCHHVSYC